MQQFPIPVVPSTLKEHSGALCSDRTRGKYHLFYVDHYQIIFADAMFRLGSQRVRELTDEGRELWRQLFDLVGKGVTIKGDFFEGQEQKNQGREGFLVPRLFVTIKSVQHSPAHDPQLPRMRQKPLPARDVAEHMRKKAEAEEAEKYKNETEMDKKVRLHNEQLEAWYADAGTEELMAREAI